MQRIFAIVSLTWKAAFRYRFFWILTVLLIGAVIAFPLLIKDDGTAQGFTQLLLTYTLSIITAVLGLCTLWLACGTLARDIEECQMQMVAVKPIPRWQIWVGKWLGIVSLNAALLAIAGTCVFFLMQYRAQQLPEDVQEVLRNEVLVARASLRPPVPDIRPDVQREVDERLREMRQQNTPVSPEDEVFVRQQVEEQVKAFYQLVPPRYGRQWVLDLGRVRAQQLRDRPLYLRIKFYSARPEAAETYAGLWEIGVPESPGLYREWISVAAESFHEFAVPPNLFDDTGRLTVRFINQNDVSLLFPLDEGLEVLYRDGGFGLNFVRGLGIILCWLGLLAALGLAAASFLSFSVAAFVSLAMLAIVFSSGTMATVVEEGTVMGVNHEGGPVAARPVDLIMVPAFTGMLKVVNVVRDFSPVDLLSTGRSITWGLLAQAFAQIVLLMGGLLAAVGIIVFNRRELATAQGNNG